MSWNINVGTRHTGIILLNTRINYFKGYPPPVDGDEWNRFYATNKNWLVVRHTPRRPTWAASTHARGTVQHMVRYQLVATHRITKVVVKVTVWQCSSRCYSEIQTEEIGHKKRCHLCTRFVNDVPSKRQEIVL